MNKNKKDILLWTGTILAILSSIAYLVLLYILINGFKVNIDSNKLLIFLGLGALNGILISISLRIQGIDLAKNLESSKEVLAEYNNLISKDNNKWLMPMWLWNTIQLIKDIIIKGGSIMLSLYFSLTIIFEGIGDSAYFLLGIVNVFLYSSFGILALARAYDHYLEHQIPLINQKINRLKKGVDKNAKQDKGNIDKENRSVRKRRDNQVIEGVISNGNRTRRSIEEGSGADK